MDNYGLLDSVVNGKDWRMGGVSGAYKDVLLESGDYTPFLPPDEYQKGYAFDTMACVTFSALNCIEILAKQKGFILNLSDRFTAKMSGTTKNGNSLAYVAESLRKNGAVFEDRYPFPRDSKDFDWNAYYAQIPQTIVDFAQGFLEDWTIQWEWIPTTKLDEALKFGPIQVTVLAWPKPVNGKYTDGGSSKRNHAVTLYKRDSDGNYIFDHYDKTKKVLVNDYAFGHALQFTLTAKKAMTLKDNMLVQDVEGNGQFGMHLNGKIMLGPAAEVLATVIMRSDYGSNGEALVKRQALDKVTWDSFPKVNLKNEPIA